MWFALFAGCTICVFSLFFLLPSIRIQRCVAEKIEIGKLGLLKSNTASSLGLIPNGGVCDPRFVFIIIICSYRESKEYKFLWQ